MLIYTIKDLGDTRVCVVAAITVYGIGTVHNLTTACGRALVHGGTMRLTTKLAIHCLQCRGWYDQAVSGASDAAADFELSNQTKGHADGS